MGGARKPRIDGALREPPQNSVRCSPGFDSATTGTWCLHLAASSGRYTTIDGSHRRVPLGCYKIGRIASGEEPKLVTNDVTHDPRVYDRQWAEDLGLVSFAGYRLLAPELSHARDGAEAASRAKSTFLANMSHEIRTPLNAVIGMTELVLKSPLSLRQREFLQVARDSGEALLAVVSDILDFSKTVARASCPCGMPRAGSPCHGPAGKSRRTPGSRPTCLTASWQGTLASIGRPHSPAIVSRAASRQATKLGNT